MLEILINSNETFADNWVIFSITFDFKKPFKIVH